MLHHRLLIAALAVGLLGLTAGAATAAVSPGQQASILAAHNALRRNTAASETRRLGQTVTIPDLTWNTAAAAAAQTWADHLLATNTFEHNPNAPNLGENIYMESGSDPTTSDGRAVASWASEVTSYTWETNSCTDVCGHYTQLVWAATTSVGCGTATDGTNTYWVCDYAPPGNFTGQRPYEPGAATTTTTTTTTPPAPGPGANQPAPPPAAALAASLTGTWSVDDFGSGAGGALVLMQTGAQVTGTYSYDDPSGCGPNTGAFTGSVNGITLTFTTVETGCGGGGGGGGTLILAGDGASFTGGATWNGTRTGA